MCLIVGRSPYKSITGLARLMKLDSQSDCRGVRTTLCYQDDLSSRSEKGNERLSRPMRNVSGFCYFLFRGFCSAERELFVKIYFQKFFARTSFAVGGFCSAEHGNYFVKIYFQKKISHVRDGGTIIAGLFFVEMIKFYTVRIKI